MPAATIEELQFNRHDRNGDHHPLLELYPVAVTRDLGPTLEGEHIKIQPSAFRIEIPRSKDFTRVPKRVLRREISGPRHSTNPTIRSGEIEPGVGGKVDSAHVVGLTCSQLAMWAARGSGSN